MPNNDMGKPENITTKTFEAAGNAMGQSPKDARENARELLEKVLLPRRVQRQELETLI